MNRMSLDRKPIRRHKRERVGQVLLSCLVGMLTLTLLRILWSASFFSSLSSTSASILSSSPFHQLQEESKPWLGSQGLRAPSVSNATNIHHHVRFIIRVHHEQADLVKGMVHSLLYQQQLSVSFPYPTLSMDFALVPTEVRGIPVVDSIARYFWLNTAEPFPHVYALDLDQTFFDVAAERAAPFKCSKEEAREVANRAGKAAMIKICRYDNHVFYQATDVAVAELCRCTWCTHAVITNGDNCYHPNYLKETLLELDPPSDAQYGTVQERSDSSSGLKGQIRDKKTRRMLAWERGEQWDMVTTDFTTSGILSRGAWGLGFVDLGGILFSKRILMSAQGFIASLPSGSRAEQAHNADWLFAARALRLGARAHVVNQLLFFHN